MGRKRRVTRAALMRKLAVVCEEHPGFARAIARAVRGEMSVDIGTFGVTLDVERKSAGRSRYFYDADNEDWSEDE